MKRLNGSAIGVILLLVCGLAARGATYYVDVDYDGSLGTPNGTTNRPFTTLSAAAAVYALSANNVVLVGGGLYSAIAAGGQESFNGTNGYNLAAKAGSWKGGYAGWQGGGNVDWSEASRTFPDAFNVNPSTMTVISLTNANSRAFFSAGADHVLVFDGFVFRDSEITTPKYDGGALYVNGSMSASVLYNCAFINNRTTQNGGGAWHGGRFSVSTNVVFLDNQATNGYGGGLYTQPGNTGQDFTGCLFAGNRAKYGGGLATSGSSGFVLTRCLFRDNTATLYGGAVGVGQKSVISGRQSRFTGNTAGRGSAIGNVDTYSGIGINLDNCLVANNTATNEGYAIYVTGTGDTASQMTLRHSTIVTNVLGGVHFRGARSNENSICLLQNMIVAFNGGNGFYCNMPVNSFARWGDPLGRPRIANSIFHGNDTNITWAGEAGTTYSVTNLATVDPAFVDAAAADFHVAFGSPAIDAGLAVGVGVDVDGVPRPLRFGFDIGAYEEWQLPLITNRTAVADDDSAEVRAAFVYESTGLVTHAWFVFDTTDKGTNSIADWAQSADTGPQVQGPTFGTMFAGLSPDTFYAYRCVASNDYGLWWGPLATFGTAPAGGAVRVWTGASTNNLASNTNNWQDGLAPGPNDYVLIDSAYTNILWTSNATMSVARWTQTETFTGTVTFMTVYPGVGAFTNFAITGDCMINGGQWRHEANSGAAHRRWYRLAVAVDGDFALGAAASINGDGLGYRDLSGPGAPGCHGGQIGFYTSSAFPGQTYGEIKAPIEPGSGGSWGGNNSAHGGGAVLLTVGGIATIEGRIGVNANASGQLNGAGGSIWLRTGQLQGYGLLEASGYPTYNGGGGRIAVAVSGSSSFGNVRMQAYSGTANGGPGGAGTVYKENASHTPGQGILLIDNGLTPSIMPHWNYGATLMPTASIWNAAVNLGSFSEIIVTNRGVLGINRDTVADLGTAPLRWAGKYASFLAVRGTEGLTLPDPFVISNFSLHWDTNVAVTGNWVVSSQGILSASILRSAQAQTDTGSTPLQNLLLTLNGNLTVDPGGVITMAGGGHGCAAGLGRAISGQSRGASHGGQGGATNGVPRINWTYGSVTNPATPGSGGYWGGDNTAEGGGVIRLAVSGATVLNGSLIATGLVTDAQSGGSILLRSGTLSGTGVVDASGFSGGTYAGGGGRIAVWLGAGTDGGGVSLRAYGGDALWDGGAGTIYIQPADKPAGAGVVLVDNNNLGAATNAYTYLPAMTNGTADELALATLWVTNRARVRLNANVTVKDAWFAAGTALDLGSNTLVIQSREHALDAAVLNPGAIVWQPPPSGAVIFLR